MISPAVPSRLVAIVCLSFAFACASTNNAPAPGATETADARPATPASPVDAAAATAASPPPDAARDATAVATADSRDAAASPAPAMDAAPTASPPAGRAFLYVQSDQRIRTFVLDVATGALTDAGMITAEKSPMYLRPSPNQKVLYAAVGDKAAAYAIDAATGALTLLNSVASPGGPPYVDVHPRGTFAVTANWNGGTTILFPLDPDGRLRDGMTAMTGMQSHSARFHPSGKYLYACSVAASQITRFSLDEASGRFTTAVTPLPGLGPRHMAFSPDGRFAYVLHERPIKITTLSVDDKTGALASLGEVSALRPGAIENKNLAAAEIAVSSSGRFVFASVRDFTTPAPPADSDLNTIAVFAIDGSSGKLTPIDFVPSGGVSPRGFVFGPGERHLFVANEVSKTIATFSVDTTTGKPQRLGAVVATGGTSIGIAIVQPR